jgi:hypothetical protein
VGVLQRFERRLEGLVEGAFARAFGGAVEPVEVGAALQREAQATRAVVGPGRVLVANAYLVELGPADAERLGEFGKPLRDELAQLLRDHAAEQGWSFVGPVSVELAAAEDVPPGTVRARGTVRTADQVSAKAPGPGTRTAPGRPRLLVVTGGADESAARSIALTQPVTVVGRGAEADVRVADTGVSRRHAELRLEPGGVRLVDLGSTNGTRVNGRRTEQAVLADGDRVELGATALVYRQDG